MKMVVQFLARRIEIGSISPQGCPQQQQPQLTTGGLQKEDVPDEAINLGPDSENLKKL